MSASHPWLHFHFQPLHERLRDQKLVNCLKLVFPLHVNLDDLKSFPCFTLPRGCSHFIANVEGVNRDALMHDEFSNILILTHYSQSFWGKWWFAALKGQSVCAWLKHPFVRYSYFFPKLTTFWVGNFSQHRKYFLGLHLSINQLAHGPNAKFLFWWE